MTSDGDHVTQSGVVQLFDVINGQVDVSRASMTFYGDREFSRFGDNVIVSSHRVLTTNDNLSLKLFTVARINTLL